MMLFPKADCLSKALNINLTVNCSTGWILLNILYCRQKQTEEVVKHGCNVSTPH